MRRILPALLGVSLIVLLGFLFFNRSKNASAAPASHIVISEIQIEGTTITDEFVELYNPTEGIVDLTGWTLYRKTAASASAETPLATISGTISPHGFLLIANTGYDGIVSGDLIYSGQNVSDNNSVLLRNASSLLIDLIGMGTSNTSETITIPNPIDNRSIERKAISSSTPNDMATGGAHALLGNGEDTDNNSLDFVRHASPNVSDPQNSLSAVEPVPTPTPTVTPTISPSPTITPIPTEEPTPTPTIEPTPTPTDEPTPTPSPTPEISPTPSGILTPTPTAFPTPTPRIIARWPNITCFLTSNTMRIMGFRFKIPSVKCVRT